MGGVPLLSLMTPRVGVSRPYLSVRPLEGIGFPSAFVNKRCLAGLCLDCPADLWLFMHDPRGCSRRGSWASGHSAGLGLGAPQSVSCRAGPSLGHPSSDFSSSFVSEGMSMTT